MAIIQRYEHLHLLAVNEISEKDVLKLEAIPGKMY